MNFKRHAKCQRTFCSMIANVPFFAVWVGFQERFKPMKLDCSMQLISPTISPVFSSTLLLGCHLAWYRTQRIMCASNNTHLRKITTLSSGNWNTHRSSVKTRYSKDRTHWKACQNPMYACAMLKHASADKQQKPNGMPKPSLAKMAPPAATAVPWSW